MHRFAPWHWLAPAIALGAMAFGSLTSGRGEPSELLQLIAQGQARDLHPFTIDSALHGDLHEGLANKSYARAAELANRLTGHISESALNQTRRLDARPTEMVELRKRWQPILALIEEGTRARRLATEPTWFVPWLSAIVEIECDTLLNESRVHQAMQVWLDSATMTIDQVRTASNPFHLQVGSSELRQLTKFWTTDRLALLSVATRRRLQQALTELEQRIGTCCDIERFVYAAAKNVTDPRFLEGQPISWQKRLSSWRDGFSLKQSYVRKAEAIARHLPDLVPAELEWLARQQQLAALRFDPDWHLQIMNYERCHRRALACLRQLRGTLLQQAGQPTETLTDPLGTGPLHIETR